MPRYSDWSVLPHSPRLLALTVLLALLPAGDALLAAEPPFLQIAQRSTTARTRTTRSQPKLISLDELLEPIRARHQLPALAAAVMRDDQLLAIGAVGVRQLGSREQVTVDDKFHLGSISKPMTSMLLGRLVDRGKLSWQTTIAQAFPELRNTIRPEYQSVTLEQLLQHRSGLPEDRSHTPEMGAFLRSLSGDIMEQRKKLVEFVLQLPPEAPAGSTFIYSNFGFCVAGAMAEVAMNQSWEELMSELVFEPIGMATAGFGPPSSPDVIDQPRGHLGEPGAYQPARPTADNVPCMGPSSRVHCSLTDLARFGSVHARYSPATAKLLSRPTFIRLHTDALRQNYGLGWALRRPSATSPEIHQHEGTNGMNFAGLYIYPAANLVIVVATNVKAKEPCVEAREAILRH